MRKKSISIITVIVVSLLFCGYPLSTTAYGAEDRITEKFDNLSFYNWCYSAGANQPPDVVVTYKDGACTVKNIPEIRHSGYGLEKYCYGETGKAGLFVVETGNLMGGMYAPEYYIVDTNKTPVTVKRAALPEFATPIRMLDNGISAFCNYNDSRESVILVKSDGTKLATLEPSVSTGYTVAVFGIDHNAQSGQYAVMYGIYSIADAESDYGKSRAKQFAGVALFDEAGKPVKQFLLKGLFYDNYNYEDHSPYGLPPERSTYGHSYYNDCGFSADPDILYANYMIPKKLVQKRDAIFAADNDNNYWGNPNLISVHGEAEFYSYYKINLKDGSYTGVSKPPESKSKAEIPLKVQYNKAGTYIYTQNGDSFTELAALKGDYVASQYAVNPDGSVQIIFVSGMKIGWVVHPITKNYYENL